MDPEKPVLLLLPIAGQQLEQLQTLVDSLNAEHSDSEVPMTLEFLAAYLFARALHQQQARQKRKRGMAV